MKTILLLLLIFSLSSSQENFEYSLSLGLNNRERLGLSTKSLYPFSLGYYGLKTIPGEIGNLNILNEYYTNGEKVYTDVSVRSYYAMGLGMFSSIKLIPKLYFDSDLSFLMAFSHGFWARPNLSLRTRLFKDLWVASSLDYTFYKKAISSNSYFKDYYESISAPTFSLSISYQRPTKSLGDKVAYNVVKFGGIGILAVFGVIFAATFHG